MALQELTTISERFDAAMIEALGDYETPSVVTKDSKMTVVRKGSTLRLLQKTNVAASPLRVQAGQEK